jgi:transcription elongation GreA/GreB family factor
MPKEAPAMKRHYTRRGLESARLRIAAQEAKVKALGKLAGEEAGMNCDWHDNFGYEDAKRRLELESTILRCQKEELTDIEIVEVVEQAERVRIGVTAKARLNGEEKEATIGAFGESDPESGLIAYHSPLGRSLLGMEAGGSKQATIGGKQVLIELLEIHPPSYRYSNLLSDRSDLDQ